MKKVFGMVLTNLHRYTIIIEQKIKSLRGEVGNERS